MMRLRSKEAGVLEKHFPAKVKDDTDEWFKELYDLFAFVREEFAEVPEETINRRIARAVKAVRAGK